MSSEVGRGMEWSKEMEDVGGRKPRCVFYQAKVSNFLY